MKKYIVGLLTCFIFYSPLANAQGVISGDLELYQNFYFLDSAILSKPIPPQYYQQLSSTDAWFNTNYNDAERGFSAGVRFDLFNNSGLRNPFAAYSDLGIGTFYVTKKIDNLEITAGNFYDQFGTGITFRAYEARGQNLDYAMRGIRAKYQLGKNWNIKAFTGRQKFRFSNYDPIVKGVNIEGFVPVNQDLSLNIGASLVNRTLDNNTLEIIVNNINNLPLEDRFIPKYNVYAYSFYNTLNFKNFSWYAEYAGKTHEAVQNRQGKLVDEPGSVIYTTLTYSRPGFGTTLQYKKTDNYEFRVSPLEIINNGLVNFIPPIARLNTGRLTSRYTPATQLIGEQGFQADIFAKIGHVDLNFNYADVTFENSPVFSLSDSNRLYREFYAESKFSVNKKLKMILGLQYQVYNQELYQAKPGYPMLRSLTPFAEITYKFNRKQSLRVELSHMQTKQDLGSWMWALVEYNVVSKYSISIMDMYNYGNYNPEHRQHYYTIFGATNIGKNRFTLGYVKQVEGINCTGGVCRLEPAFNGVRATITSSF